jgi:peptide chain release factor 3
VDLYAEGLPYEYLRWVEHDGDEPLRADDLILPNDAMLVEDYKGRQLLLFASFWSINWTAERNKQITLTETRGERAPN